MTTRTAALIVAAVSACGLLALVGPPAAQAVHAAVAARIFGV